MDRAYAVLQAHHVQAASLAPQRLPDWNKNAAGIRAFYFKDPDGHPLEILQFPSGKGDPRWHRDSGKLFLGIDHTAIAVSDTQASLKFYRDLLGLRIVGQSENYGPEQERLNNVPGAHLRITTLRASSGLRIELLEYLSPRSGRKLPYDAQAADLVNRQTVLIADPQTSSRILQREFADAAHLFATDSGFTIRDPDGHKLLIRAADNSTTTIGEVK
jgi:catechol 2,3-dioxygenase-like lactoylglutathione lyase family enzyme